MHRALGRSVEELLTRLLMLLGCLCWVAHGRSCHVGILRNSHMTHETVCLLRHALGEVVHSWRSLRLVVTLHVVLTMPHIGPHLVSVALWSCRAVLMRRWLRWLLLERGSTLFGYLHGLRAPGTSTVRERLASSISLCTWVDMMPSRSSRSSAVGNRGSVVARMWG